MTDSTEIEMAWAAGLFEGEGCVTVTRSKRGENRIHRTYALLTISMTDMDPLVRFSEAVGFGRVNGPYPSQNPKHKPKWKWNVSGKKAGALLEDPMFFCWLGIRRRARIAEVLTIIDAQPPLPKRYATKTVCPQGHPYFGENVLVDRKGHRSCRECRRTSAREYQRARRRRERLALEMLAAL